MKLKKKCKSKKEFDTVGPPRYSMHPPSLETRTREVEKGQEDVHVRRERGRLSMDRSKRGEEQTDNRSSKEMQGEEKSLKFRGRSQKAER